MKSAADFKNPIFSEKKEILKTGLAPLKNAVPIKVWSVWRIEFL